MTLKRLSLAALAVSVVLFVPRLALAHAHLVASTPAANAVVPAGSVAVDLQYNSRVDLKGCMITLVMPDGHVQRVALDRQSNQTNLDAHLTLRPGSYTLRWQALSTDGHITRGDIPFRVR